MERLTDCRPFLVFVAVALLAAGSGRAAAQCETAKLTGSAASAGGSLGDTLDLSGDVAIVGGYWGGAAYIYRFDGATWTEEAVLVDEDADSQDLFGRAVAIDGDVAVVGASSDHDNGLLSGSAYVFRYEADSSSWAQEAKLLPSDGAPNGHFGFSVAVSGGWVVVGSIGAEGEAGNPAGAVYAFQHDGSDWVEVAKLTSPDQEAMFFGTGVDIDDEVLVVLGGGGSWVFRFDGLTWLPEAQLVAGNIAVCGDVIVVGKPSDNNSEGSARIYRFDGIDWILEAFMVPPEDTEANTAFGGAVALDEDVVIVGGTNADFNGWFSSAAYAFHYDGSDWAQEAIILLASDGAAYDHFGKDVAVLGDVALVGADGVDNGTGAVYVFAGISGADCNDNGVADACEDEAEDADGNGVPDECECPWDLDGDGSVGVVDLVQLILAWGATKGNAADFDGDGMVDEVDLLGAHRELGIVRVMPNDVR